MRFRRKTAAGFQAILRKKNGYLSSIELSKRFGLYRQDYCGCIYSKNERADFERHKRERELLQPVKTEM
nr:epoxyqueuosine reductase QueH [Treponema phagedenis]